MSDFYQQDPSLEKTSKINSAGLINIRIHNLWVDAHKAVTKGNYNQWNVVLDRIWTELAGDVDPTNEKGKKTLKEYKEICVEVGKASNLGLVSKRGFESSGVSGKLSRVSFYQALMGKEVFLRRLFNTQGKGTAYHDLVDDYMD